MMNLTQLTTFVAVISEGSMTAAADKLYLTQPAVSQQIRNLEEDLGVELMVRGVRQIKATPQGEVLYEQAKRILQMVQQTENSIKAMAAELTGHIKFGTLNSIGLHLMSPIVSRLLRHNPDLSMTVEYEKGDGLVQAFKKGKFDVIIVPELGSEFNGDLEGAEKKFLLKEEMWLVGSGKELDMPPQIMIQEFSRLPVVSLSDEFPVFNNLLNSKLKESNVKVNQVFESSNVGTLKRVIENGLGWGFLPAHSIKKQVRAGRLSRIHVKDLHYEMDLMYYYKKNSENKTLAETFYQALSQQERA